MYKAGYEDGKRSSDEYGKGYDDGIAVGYLNGLNDAWECARKIVCDDGLECEELNNIFGYRSTSTILNLSASEAIAKIKEYEEKQKKDCESKDVDCYEQEDDELCGDFECAYNFKGECKNAKKCDDFKPITKNEIPKQQIGKSCMNCKYHVTDYYPNPDFPCSLIRRGLSCTNLSAWESNVIEELYSNEEKQADDEIKVGDEVIFSKEWYKTKAVIININRESNTAVCLCADDDDCVFVLPSSLTKTGRHFPQIAEVLKQMK